MMWKIWIASSNVFTKADELSEIVASELPLELQEISEPNWKGIAIEYMDPELQKIGENSRGKYYYFSIGLEPFAFPDAQNDLMEIQEALSKRYKYIAMDGKDQSEDTKYPFRFVAENKVLALHNASLEDSVSHNHDQGEKELLINCRKLKPIFK